ncbi:hypothetical protein HKD37_16G045142 [Glycine soja]
MSKRLQEDWARVAEEGPRVLMNLRTHLLLEVASPLSLPSPFRCHLSSKKQRNPLMKKILGLQAPMELASITLFLELRFELFFSCWKDRRKLCTFVSHKIGLINRFKGSKWSYKVLVLHLEILVVLQF